MKKKIIDPELFYQIYHKSLNAVCMIKLMIALIRYCQVISAHLGKSFAYNISH